METHIVKMKTGEEVICGYKVDTEKNIVILTKPVMIVQTSQGMGFVPWMGMVEDWEMSEFVIPVDHILCAGIPRRELLNAYNEKFGSGIVTAPAGLDLTL